MAGPFSQAGLGRARSGSSPFGSGLPASTIGGESFTLGVGPAGNYVAGLGPAANGRPEGEPRQPVAAGPFEITVCAWTVIGRFDRASRSAFDSNS